MKTEYTWDDLLKQGENADAESPERNAYICAYEALWALILTEAGEDIKTANKPKKVIDSFLKSRGPIYFDESGYLMPIVTRKKKEEKKMYVEGVEEGKEEVALKDCMEKYIKNYKAVSPEDRNGKYKKAFVALYEKIMDLGNIVLRDTVYFLDTSYFTDDQKKVLLKIFDDAAADLKKAFSRMSYSAFKDACDDMRKKYVDTYISLISGTYTGEENRKSA